MRQAYVINKLTALARTTPYMRVEQKKILMNPTPSLKTAHLYGRYTVVGITIS